MKKTRRESFTKFSLQLGVKKEYDRTSSWIYSIKDQTSADSAVQPENRDNLENEKVFTINF